MANIRNLQDVLNWCAPFLKYHPLAINGNEPLLTSANTVLQTILGAPFCWRWNRGTATFNVTQAGGQDYIQSVTDFGFVERAWTVAASGGDIKEIEFKVSASASAEVARPSYVTAQQDDNAGNITFRLNTVPDQNYAVNVQYQKKAPLLASLA